MASIIKRPNNIRIGELLVLAGLLSQTQLQEAIRHSGNKRLQIGQILVMHNYLSARELQVALDGQSMIRDKQLDVPQAVRYIKTACRNGTTFAEVFSSEEGADPGTLRTGKLGELLFEAEVITQDQFTRAMQRSLATGVALGRMLVLDKVLSESFLDKALEIQTRLRDDMLTRDEAITALQELSQPGSDAPKSSEKEPLGATIDLARRSVVRLGELMVLAGLLTESDVMNALEIGLVTGKPIGQAMVDQKMVTQELINAAMAIQKLVDENKIDVTQASEALNNVASEGISVSLAVAEVNQRIGNPVDVIDFKRLLTLSRTVSNDDIDDAFALSFKSAQIIGRMLLLTGHVDEASIQVALRCHQLMNKGLLAKNDAVAALDYCLHYRSDKTANLEDSLRELGWKANEQLRLEGEKGTREVYPVSTGPGKGKHVDTIPPEDPRSKQIAMIVAKGIEGDANPIRTEKEASKVSQILSSTFIRLAESYAMEGNYVEAQVLFERILVSRLNELGPNHEGLTADLNNLSNVLCVQGKFNQAEPFMRRAVSILANSSDPDSVILSNALSNLAGIYFTQGKFAESEPLYLRVLEIQQEQLAPDHPDLADTLAELAKLYKKTNRVEDAEKYYALSQNIKAKNLISSGT